MLRQAILALWYGPRWCVYPLAPLSWLFRLFAALRRYVLTYRAKPLPLPVIVVGNICVGGNGKTPVVIALANALKAKGFKPGIVSRGYGRKNNYPYQYVSQTSDPALVGDEPLVIVQQTGCPMMVGARRAQLVEQLAQKTDCDIIISDDGLQHYAMPRQIELAVVSGQGRFGNGFCLPLGPLREPISRLATVDYILSPEPVDSEIGFKVITSGFYYVANDKVCQLDELQKHPCIAIAGIAKPSRFFNALKQHFLTTQNVVLPDHHAFTPQDFSHYDKQSFFIMTEKDAVKCRAFANENMVYLRIQVEFETGFLQRLQAQLAALTKL